MKRLWRILGKGYPRWQWTIWVVLTTVAIFRPATPSVIAIYGVILGMSLKDAARAWGRHRG